MNRVSTRNSVITLASSEDARRLFFTWLLTRHDKIQGNPFVYMYVHICNLHIASVRLSYFLVSKYLNKVFQQLCKLFFFNRQKQVNHLLGKWNILPSWCSNQLMDHNQKFPFLFWNSTKAILELFCLKVFLLILCVRILNSQSFRSLFCSWAATVTKMCHRWKRTMPKPLTKHQNPIQCEKDTSKL